MVSMDWIRRNWPDLLIGLALLLVIGGIIATLLNGGNFLPFGRGALQEAFEGGCFDIEVEAGPVGLVDEVDESFEIRRLADLGLRSGEDRPEDP